MPNMSRKKATRSQVKEKNGVSRRFKTIIIIQFEIEFEKRTSSYVKRIEEGKLQLSNNSSHFSTESFFK